MGAHSRQKSLGMLQSDLGNSSAPKDLQWEFRQEEVRAQPDFFARRHSEQYSDVDKADTGAGTGLGEASRRHRAKYNTTSGFLLSGQPEKGLDGTLKPVRRPSISSKSSFKSGKSTLSSSASDSALLPLLAAKKQEGCAVARIKDPFECKWMEVDVIKTAKGEKVLREDFHVVFDLYHALDRGVSLSNSRYKEAFTNETRSRAMQMYQSLMMRRVRSGSRWLTPSFQEFLNKVWPQLSEKEEILFLSWADVRERQLNALSRLAMESDFH